MKILRSLVILWCLAVALTRVGQASPSNLPAGVSSSEDTCLESLLPGPSFPEAPLWVDDPHALRVAVRINPTTSSAFWIGAVRASDESVLVQIRRLATTSHLAEVQTLLQSPLSGHAVRDRCEEIDVTTWTVRSDEAPFLDALFARLTGLEGPLVNSHRTGSSVETCEIWFSSGLAESYYRWSEVDPLHHDEGLHPLAAWIFELAQGLAIEW